MFRIFENKRYLKKLQKERLDFKKYVDNNLDKVRKENPKKNNDELIEILNQNFINK